MRSLLSVLVILVLLSYVPPVRSGLNMYIRRIYSTCWRLKGVCKRTCAKKEVYHILCDTATLCCISAKDLPPLVGK
ncbi:beta-defensin 135 [Equus asinus]|uniref:Beta-defensin n=1 Tax=Equus asinus TaxID=9793 RepID=A0A9L0JQB0_EQUAS|nr:beta-defensin 135 [Equus asinus]